MQLRSQYNKNLIRAVFFGRVIVDGGSARGFAPDSVGYGKYTVGVSPGNTWYLIRTLGDLDSAASGLVGELLSDSFESLSGKGDGRGGAEVELESGSRGEEELCDWRSTKARRVARVPL